MENGKICSFERDTNFFAVKTKLKKNFVGYIYSGISIINKKTLNLNFKNFKNFEKQFYPEVIKMKNQLEHINGFWYSIDNQKDLSYINDKTDKNLKKKLNLLIKKIR